jgi:nitrate/nitrite-specific signal transduction histidine kinase
MPTAVFNFPLRRSLLLAIKEALNNALKHSGATELHLQIHWEDPRLVVVVRDNGRGFDLKAVKPGRNGLTNIVERLRELDGDCHITSEPGEGCRVEFRISLKSSVRSAWLRILKEKLNWTTQLRRRSASH